MNFRARQQLVFTLHNKKTSPRINTDDTDLQIRNSPIELFDPSKSVFISVIRGEICFLCKQSLFAI